MQYVLFRNLSDIQPVSAPCLHPPAWKVNRPAEGRRVFLVGSGFPVHLRFFVLARYTIFLGG